MDEVDHVVHVEMDVHVNVDGWVTHDVVRGDEDAIIDAADDGFIGCVVVSC